MLDFLADQILLRRGLYDQEGRPRLATGAIVFGALLRALSTILLGFALWHYAGVEYSIPVSLALLWGYVVYPAYRQLVVYSETTAKIEEELLCNTCRHYNSSGQFCLLYDQHVGPEHIPCEGMDWEPS
ncbi:MAG: DUF4407 domain-containing protein [Candidatus Kapabacteria bacterium]|nr:DUF4407 domain-containing protein [Candidatus Kapabacteria bacterium]